AGTPGRVAIQTVGQRDEILDDGAAGLHLGENILAGRGGTLGGAVASGGGHGATPQGDRHRETGRARRDQQPQRGYRRTVIGPVHVLSVRLGKSEPNLLSLLNRDHGLDEATMPFLARSKATLTIRDNTYNNILFGSCCFPTKRISPTISSQTL